MLMGFSKISEKILYNACILGTINLDQKMKVTIVDENCVLQDLSTQYCKEKVHTFAPEIFL